MFNKYQRDQQVKRVAEMQKRRIVSGYLQDEMFETSPSVQRMISKSPNRASLNEPSAPLSPKEDTMENSQSYQL